MAKRKTTAKTTTKTPTKTSTKPAPKKQKSPAQLAVQEAGAITGRILGDLQNARKTFLRIGQLLTEVRDRKHYATLHHETLEEYADKRLGLSRRSLYRYIQVYAWALEHHKEWLEPKIKVRIPDLYEIEGLVWIDQELDKKNLADSRKATLETVRQKALIGDLSNKELQALRRRTNQTDKAVSRLITATRALRKRYADTRSDAAQSALPLFDQIIKLMGNEQVVASAGLEILDNWRPASGRAGFLSRNMQYA